MSPLPGSSTPSQSSLQVEVVYVKLPDGTIVARTRDELAALPPDLRAELVLLPEQG